MQTGPPHLVLLSQVSGLECVACLDPKDGATCSDTTTRGNDTLAHGSISLASVRIKPNYWRLSARSTSLSHCLESADGNGACTGGSDAGNEDEIKPGYTGSGYCKVDHTGPLCQVCNTSDHYFDRDTAMECIECPGVSERLALPLGIIGGLLALVILALAIKRSSSLAPCPPRLLLYPAEWPASNLLFDPPGYVESGCTCWSSR